MSVPPIDPKKPDLEESTNVAQQHAEVMRSANAAAREKQVRENGLEPVSMWIFILGSIVAIIAGSVLFKSNSLFDYDSFVKSGYTQAEDPDPTKSVPQEEIQKLYMSIGKAKYTGCAACHQASGMGVPGAFPPLGGSKWVTESPVIPAFAVIHGVKGKIDVAGSTYNGNMAAQGGDTMGDLELAALIYYIQNSFGNKVGVLYTPEQIAQIRKLSNERSESGQCTSAELEKYLGKKLDGEPYKPGTIVNKKTGEILEAK